MSCPLQIEKLITSIDTVSLLRCDAFWSPLHPDLYISVLTYLAGGTMHDCPRRPSHQRVAAVAVKLAIKELRFNPNVDSTSESDDWVGYADPRWDTASFSLCEQCSTSAHATKPGNEHRPEKVQSGPPSPSPLRGHRAHSSPVRVGCDLCRRTSVPIHVVCRDCKSADGWFPRHTLKLVRSMDAIISRWYHTRNAAASSSTTSTTTGSTSRTSNSSAASDTHSATIRRQRSTAVTSPTQSLSAAAASRVSQPASDSGLSHVDSLLTQITQLPSNDFRQLMIGIKRKRNDSAPASRESAVPDIVAVPMSPPQSLSTAAQCEVSHLSSTNLWTEEAVELSEDSRGNASLGRVWIGALRNDRATLKQSQTSHRIKHLAAFKESFPPQGDISLVATEWDTMERIRMFEPPCLHLPRMFGLANLIRPDPESPESDRGRRCMRTTYAMEFVRGIPLAWLLSDDAKDDMPKPNLLAREFNTLAQDLRSTLENRHALALQLAAACAHLEAVGIHHRDIKPDNILVCSSLLHGWLRSNDVDEIYGQANDADRDETRILCIDGFGPNPSSLSSTAEKDQFRLVLLDFNSSRARVMCRCDAAARQQETECQCRLAWDDKVRLCDWDGGSQDYKEKAWHPTARHQTASLKKRTAACTDRLWHSYDTFAIGLLLLDLYRGRTMASLEGDFTALYRRWCSADLEQASHGRQPSVARYFCEVDFNLWTHNPSYEEDEPTDVSKYRYAIPKPGSRRTAEIKHLPRVYPPEFIKANQDLKQYLTRHPALMELLHSMTSHSNTDRPSSREVLARLSEAIPGGTDARSDIKAQLSAFALEEMDIDNDGDCFFRAVATGLLSQPSCAAVLASLSLEKREMLATAASQRGRTEAFRKLIAQDFRCHLADPRYKDTQLTHATPVDDAAIGAELDRLCRSGEYKFDSFDAVPLVVAHHFGVEIRLIQPRLQPEIVPASLDQQEKHSTTTPLLTVVKYANHYHAAVPVGSQCQINSRSETITVD